MKTQFLSAGLTLAVAVLALAMGCSLPGVSAQEKKQPQPDEIAGLVKQLSSDKYQERVVATKRLTEIGDPALDALCKAATSNDPEVCHRAEKIIIVIENNICVEQLRLTGHKPNPKFKGHYGNGPVTAVAVSADGKRLLTGGYDQTLRLWDAVTGKELRVFEGHTYPVTSAVLSPDGTRALSASGDNSVRLWDATTGQGICILGSHQYNWASSVAFGPKGQALSGGGNGAMYLWDLNTWEKTSVFICHTKPGIVAVSVAVAYSENANLAATSGNNHLIGLWNLDTGKEVRKIAGTDSAGAVCFSPDGKRLAACRGNQVCIWEVETGKELLRIDGTNAGCVAFSPNGKRLVTGGGFDDKTVRIWDAKTGKELRKYEGHTSAVVCVTFFPNGKRIASASYDGTARIWGAPR